MSIELVIPSNHFILHNPILLLPSVFPSIRVFSSESVLHIRWPKYWSFSISLSNQYSGLISFRIDWFDLLAVQGTLKSLLQHHSSKACFSVLSFLYGPTLTSVFQLYLERPSYCTPELVVSLWSCMGRNQWIPWSSFHCHIFHVIIKTFGIMCQ